MTNSPDERGVELRELFFETSQELLQALNEEALKLEKNPGDEEIVRSIRRTVHTLKGDSAACGLRELSELAHQFEDALVAGGHGLACRGGRNRLCRRRRFQRDDRGLPQRNEAAIHQEPKQEDSRSDGRARRRKDAAQEESHRETGRLKTSTAKASASRASAKAAAALWTEYEKLAMTKAQATGLAVYHVVVKIDPHCAMPIAGRQLIHNALAPSVRLSLFALTRSLRRRPSMSSLCLASSQTVEQIAAKGRIPTIAEEVTVELLLAANPAPQPAAGSRRSRPETRPMKLLRVDTAAA